MRHVLLFILSYIFLISSAQANGLNGPFSPKLWEGKKLFARNHGFQIVCITAGTYTGEFSIPYEHAKIDKVDIINGEANDKVNFKVATVNGSIVLNQFAFDLNVSKDYMSQTSAYDADLFLGLKLSIEYTCQSARTIGVNLRLHEVKQ